MNLSCIRNTWWYNQINNATNTQPNERNRERKSKCQLCVVRKWRPHVYAFRIYFNKERASEQTKNFDSSPRRSPLMRWHNHCQPSTIFINNSIFVFRLSFSVFYYLFEYYSIWCECFLYECNIWTMPPRENPAQNHLSQPSCYGWEWKAEKLSTK